MMPLLLWSTRLLLRPGPLLFRVMLDATAISADAAAILAGAATISADAAERLTPLNG
jgi:hypothetical protein